MRVLSEPFPQQTSPPQCLPLCAATTSRTRSRVESDMLQLRIQQHSLAEGRHRVEIALEGDGARRTAESTFEFSLSPQDEEGLRWYLEDFLQYPQDPAPSIARRVEGRMEEIGNELFQAVFQASDDSRDLWAELRKRLP